MNVDPVDLRISDWYAFLVLASIGFLTGLASDTRGSGRYLAVALAQLPYLFPETELPLLPRCVRAGMLGPALFAGVDSQFRAGYPLFSIFLPCCFISTGIWLFIASRWLRSDKKRRKAEIERFLADPGAPVLSPHTERASPDWLKVWNRRNVTFFFILMARAVIAMVTLRH